jgi:uncharacterized protein (TIGR02145 family)
MIKDLIDRIWSHMVEVEGGTFRMGATSGQDEHPFEDEGPVHAVTLDTFRLCRYPVTRGEWQALMGPDPVHVRDDPNLPVSSVSWEDAEDFISQLNALTTGGYRLPTEAEWEYAARGGCQSRAYRFSGSPHLDEVAWTVRNSGNHTHPVGRLKPNALGLYDMSGNLREWCQDWYGLYAPDPQVNPEGSASGQRRVLRGGSYYNDPCFARVTYRCHYPPGHRSPGNGFRLAFEGHPPVFRPARPSGHASVTIGHQVWMADNLNTDRFRNGDPIPSAGTVGQWLRAEQRRQPAWCYYDNDPEAGATYGKLYNGYAVNDPRGLAPEGWHVPTDAEWTVLIEALGGKWAVARNMKAADGEVARAGTHSRRFAVHLGGRRDEHGRFDSLGEDGYWWSATPTVTDRALLRSLHPRVDRVLRCAGKNGLGFSVRCVRDLPYGHVGL